MDGIIGVNEAEQELSTKVAREKRAVLRRAVAAHFSDFLSTGQSCFSCQLLVHASRSVLRLWASWRSMLGERGRRPVRRNHREYFAIAPE